MPPRPPVPRRSLLFVPALALAACGPGDPAGPTVPPSPGAALAARRRALLAGDLDRAVAVVGPDEREALRRADATALAAGLDDWAVEGLPGAVESAGQGRGLLRVRVAGEARAVASGVVVRWDGALHLAADTPQPWDLSAPVTAQRVAGGVVLHVGDPSAVGREVADGLADATARVDAAWGTDWPRGTAVVVVPDAADVTRLAGTGGDVDAVAVGLDADLADGAPAGVRVVLSTERFTALSPLGRAVVLTHELVHVATRATPRPPGAVVPRWLTEGHADHVARRGRDVSATALAAALLADPGRPQVPADADFTAADPGRVQIAYAAAWTLVTSAARAVGPLAGTPAVTALVRDVWTGTPLEAACSARLGRPFADVVATWRRDVATHLVGWVP
ncbi:serine/threonine-protein kinase [Kineococcus endophyticus]